MAMQVYLATYNSIFLSWENTTICDWFIDPHIYIQISVTANKLGSTLPILSLLTSWFTGQADVVVITDLLVSQQGPCLTVRHTPTPPSPTAIGGKSPSLKNWAGSQLQPKGGASGDLVHGAVEQSKNYHYQILYDDSVQKLIKAGAKQKKPRVISGNTDTDTCSCPSWFLHLIWVYSVTKP